MSIHYFNTTTIMNCDLDFFFPWLYELSQAFSCLMGLQSRTFLFATRTLCPEWKIVKLKELLVGSFQQHQFLRAKVKRCPVSISFSLSIFHFCLKLQCFFYMRFWYVLNNGLHSVSCCNHQISVEYSLLSVNAFRQICWFALH